MAFSLNDKQIRFCNEYLVDYNAKKAAIRAGYSPKTAQEQSSRLLSNVKVAHYLESKAKKIENKLGISAERTLNEIGRLAFSDIRKLYNADGGLKNIHDLDDDAAAILAGVESYEEQISESPEDESVKAGSVKKVKIYDKTKALEMLGKHFGLFEKDNEQRKPEAAPFSDDQVNKIIKSLRGKDKVA